jgi:hypothetical protein
MTAAVDGGLILTLSAIHALAMVAPDAVKSAIMVVLTSVKSPDGTAADGRRGVPLPPRAGSPIHPPSGHGHGAPCLLARPSSCPRRRRAPEAAPRRRGAPAASLATSCCSDGLPCGGAAIHSPPLALLCARGSWRPWQVVGPSLAPGAPPSRQI